VFLSWNELATKLHVYAANLSVVLLLFTDFRIHLAAYLLCFYLHIYVFYFDPCIMFRIILIMFSSL